MSRGPPSYVMKAPDGINAKDFAKHNAPTITANADHSYDCKCGKCKGTGKIYNGKCFRCDGKGWMSPIDLSRYAKWQAKQPEPAKHAHH